MSSRGEFGDGLPLELGSLIGRRKFNIGTRGELTPLSYGDMWRGGENIAKCAAYAPPKGTPELAEHEAAEDYAERNRITQEWRNNGHGLDVCDHGFWAYWDNGQTEYRHDTLDAVIEGYGEVLIGTKGFRCMKAKILAVSFQSEREHWVLSEHVKEMIKQNYPNVMFYESTLAMESEFTIDRYEDHMSHRETSNTEEV